MTEVTTVLQKPRLWPQTIKMSDQSQSRKAQVNQKKTNEMVGKSHEDGEEAFTYVNVERPQIRWKLQKEQFEWITYNDEAIYIAACHAQSNDGQTYTGVGKLNGQRVKVLRDTGCTVMNVDTSLIPKAMVIAHKSGSLQIVDHTLIDVPLANISWISSTTKDIAFMTTE